MNKVYKIEQDTADQDIENQFIIKAKAEYALLMDYEYLVDSEERIFKLREEDDKIILDELEEVDENKEKAELEPEDELDRMTNSELIDAIIRNSLLSTKPITLEQAQTMMTLAGLQAILDAE